MKTQLSCIVLLALITLSLSFLKKKESTVEGENNEILRFRNSLYKAEEFQYEIDHLFKGQNVKLTTIDFTEASINEGVGYWELIDLIDSIVDQEVESISLIFSDSLISTLKNLGYDHILAEMAIATETIHSRIVPSFDTKKLKENNHAYDAIIRFKKSILNRTNYQRGTLTVDLPTFNAEAIYLRNPNDSKIERNPFVRCSKTLYDYIFGGIDFSEVRRINVFNLSLDNYFGNFEFPNLKVVNFDFSLYTNSLRYDDHEPQVELLSYVDAFIGKASTQELTITFDKKGFNLDYEEIVAHLKYGVKLTLY